MYLEIPEELPEHPKSIALSEAIGDPLAWAYMFKLWRWCTKYAKDGSLTRFSTAQIEGGVNWTGERGALFAAMKSAGFLDVSPEGSVTVHDWHHHTGKALAKMAADAQRKSDERARKLGALPIPVDTPSNGHPTDIQRTAAVAKLSEAKRSEADQETPAAPDKPAPPRTRRKAKKDAQPSLPMTFTIEAMLDAIRETSGGKILVEPFDSQLAAPLTKMIRAITDGGCTLDDVRLVGEYAAAGGMDWATEPLGLGWLATAGKLSTAIGKARAWHERGRVLKVGGNGRPDPREAPIRPVPGEEATMRMLRERGLLGGKAPG